MNSRLYFERCAGGMRCIPHPQTATVYRGLLPDGGIQQKAEGQGERSCGQEMDAIAVKASNTTRVSGSQVTVNDRGSSRDRCLSAGHILLNETSLGVLQKKTSVRSCNRALSPAFWIGVRRDPRFTVGDADRN